ncbi:MAG TPA: hypothetical protein EYP20_01215 [Aigarchaeota archaeon]|nr:hypothetical protein [Aigarchaeota archaeon]
MLRVVNVYVEGDCRLFQEFMQRVRERLASMNRATLESIFEAFMVEAKRCSLRLMWNEINIEVTDPVSSSWFRVIARGALLYILLAVKSACATSNHERLGFLHLLFAAANYAMCG